MADSVGRVVNSDLKSISDLSARSVEPDTPISNDSNLVTPCVRIEHWVFLLYYVRACGFVFPFFFPFPLFLCCAALCGVWSVSLSERRARGTKERNQRCSARHNKHTPTRHQVHTIQHTNNTSPFGVHGGLRCGVDWRVVGCLFGSSARRGAVEMNGGEENPPSRYETITTREPHTQNTKHRGTKQDRNGIK